MVSADRETRDQAPGCQLQILKLNSAPGTLPCPRLGQAASQVAFYICLIFSFLSIYLLFSTFSCQYFGLVWIRSKTNQPGSRIASEHHNMEISLSWFSGAFTGHHHTGNCSTAVMGGGISCSMQWGECTMQRVRGTLIRAHGPWYVTATNSKQYWIWNIGEGELEHHGRADDTWQGFSADLQADTSSSHLEFWIIFCTIFNLLKNIFWEFADLTEQSWVASSSWTLHQTRMRYSTIFDCIILHNTLLWMLAHFWFWILKTTCK